MPSRHALAVGYDRFCAASTPSPHLHTTSSARSLIRFPRYFEHGSKANLFCVRVPVVWHGTSIRSSDALETTMDMANEIYMGSMGCPLGRYRWNTCMAAALEPLRISPYYWRGVQKVSERQSTAIGRANEG